MALNQYDSPAQSNFVDTYSPIPFNELMQAGAMKQKAYETGLDNLMKTYEDTHNLKYIPGSVDEQYIKQQVIPSAKAIVDKYSTQDLSDPTVRRQMRTDFASNIDSNRVKDIQDSHAAWMDNQKWRQKLKSEGKYQDFLDTPDSGYDTSTNGVYSKLTEAFQEARPIAEQYFNNLEGDSYTDPKTGEVRIAINPRKIEQTAAGAVQSFLETNAGQQKVRQFKQQNPNAKVSDAQIAHQYLTEVGKEKLMNQHQAFEPEYMNKKDKEPGSQYYKVERTPVVDVNKREIKSTDFDLQKPEAGLKYNYSSDQPSASQSKGFANTGLGMTHGGKPYYDDKVLHSDEMKKVINIISPKYKDIYDKLNDPDFAKNNPDERKAMQADLYGKMKNTYQQLEKELQQGSYLNAYYPHKIEGIKESHLNNVDTNTDYVFGTDELKKVGAANVANREFIDLENGRTYNGKDFNEEVIKKQLKQNENALIKVTGDYHYENPFSALTNNENFSNAYQVTVNGKQYVMSGEASNSADPISNFKKHANKSYSLVKFNPGIPIDEGDGTLKLYNNGVYSIVDKNTHDTLGESDNFTSAYEQARENLRSKSKK
jgi:hypothetical protein